ncbi:MAG: hypothetical protein GJ680_17700 [Alteromonadaceae bacterium]|nr:hypothetical protein [Alteromonadaceae bacterium]
MWLFPDISVGACIFHGQIEVEQLDSLDVDAHLLAFEHLKDEPRTLEYYQKMLALRLDPETAAEAMFNESQLSPAKSAEQLRAEEQEIQDEIAQKKALQEEHKEQFLEDVKEQNNGEIPQGFEQPDMPEPNVVVAQKAIERGDFDGKKLMDDVKKQKEEAEKQRKEMEKELEEAQAMAEKTMKSADPEKLAELQTKDDVTEQIISMQEMAKNEALEIDEEQLKLIQENQFKAQQLASEPLSDKPNTDEAQARRAIFINALENQESLHHRNWAGADLSDLVLDGIDLTGCNFENCTFNNTSFKNANLCEAALLGALITNSTFTSAQLKDANFSSVIGYGNNFAQCDLQKALFVKTNLRNCDFNSAIFKTAIISEASIVKSVFNGANITTLCINNSNMSDNDFVGCHGEMFVSFNVDFRFTRFSGSQLTRSAFLDSNLSVANFTETKLERCQFSGETLMTSANFSSCVAEQCGLRRVSAEHLQATSAQFTMCDLGDSDFHGSNLLSARFIQCVMSESRLHDCKLQHSTFYGSLLRQTQLLRCKLNDSNFYQADAVLAYVHQSN